MNPPAEVVIGLFERRGIDRELARQSESAKEIQGGTQRRATLGAQQARLLRAIA
jgi:hypothetical protein